MPKYVYKAKNIKGTMINGTLEANTREEVVNHLRQREYYPVSISLDQKERDLNIDLFNKVTLKDLSLFCRQFAFVIQSGTPMLRAVELSMEQTDNKKMKEILGRVHDKIQKGRSLSDSLRFEEEIPYLMINMIEAGEASGKLDYIMTELSEYYKKQYKQKQKVAQATLYPKIVITFSCMIVAFLLTTVVPSFVSNLGDVGGELPLPTKIIMVVGEFAKNWLLVIIALIVAIVCYKKFVLDKDVKYQIWAGKKSLEGKLFGKINKQLVAGRFANTLSVLASSGLGIIKCLDISARVLENKYIEEKIELAKEDVKKGHPIGKTLEDLQVFPLMLTQMITVGEETGELEEILKKTSEFYDGEVEAAIEKMVTIIEPVLIVVLAFIVLVIVSALMLPMFNMMDAISSM